MPTTAAGKSGDTSRLGRTLAAAAVGLAGCLVIWVLAPYFNYIIAAPAVSDDYMPIGALFLILLLVAGVNPLLRWLRPRLALGTSQLAVACGMMLVASVVPGQGLLRMLPYSLANVPLTVREDKALAEAYEKAHLPAALFPDRLGYEAPAAASEQFMAELPPGRSVPWRAWVGPLLSWGALLGCSWLMMMGLSLIVLPQWQRNERLPFPLLTVQQSLIAEPDEGRLLPPLFRSGAFLIAAGAVFLLHLLEGLNAYWPHSVPAIPVSWDVTRLFREGLWRQVPAWIGSARVYFIFIGVAYFMPSRTSFSIWFFVLFYAAYRAVGRSYFEPFDDWNLFASQRTGAMVVLAGTILWLGRQHWARVFGALFRRGGDEQARADRRAGVMFLAGCAGMWAWLAWAGVHAGWAAFFVAFGFMVTLLITRLVAETGMPFARIDCKYRTSFIYLAPMKWLGPATLFFSTVAAVLFPLASRVSAGPLATHALSLDERSSPSRRSWLALGFVPLLLIGLIVCGGALLYFNYHHGATLDGRDSPVNSWGAERFNQANTDLLAWRDGRQIGAPFNSPGHIAFGAALAAALYWACLAWPKWPLHPIGLLLANTWYGNRAWASMFLGWMAKGLIVRYGGARLYRAARPVFLGLIVGEVASGVFWALEPAVRVALHLPYKSIYVAPL